MILQNPLRMKCIYVIDRTPFLDTAEEEEEGAIGETLPQIVPSKRMNCQLLAAPVIRKKMKLKTMIKPPNQSITTKNVRIQ